MFRAHHFQTAQLPFARDTTTTRHGVPVRRGEFLGLARDLQGETLGERLAAVRVIGISTSTLGWL